MNSLSLTVGIPTCYGAASLLKTVRSLRSSRLLSDFKLIVAADRTPFSSWEKKQLAEQGAELIWNEFEGSQFKKVKQLVEHTESDIFVFTQDDIVFSSETLSRICQAFEQDPELTMVSVRIYPLPAETVVERGLAFMVRMVAAISRGWRGGDNYLAASGRCMAFRTSFIKQFSIPERVINGDMYLYLENKYHGGKFAYLSDDGVFIRCPQSTEEQLRPSSRFQHSYTEMKRYFSDSIASEYAIPRSVLIRAVVTESLRDPLSAAIYAVVFVYTRLKKYKKDILSVTQWQADVSTKL